MEAKVCLLQSLGENVRENIVKPISNIPNGKYRVEMGSAKEDGDIIIDLERISGFSRRGMLGSLRWSIRLSSIANAHQGQVRQLRNNIYI